MPSKRWYLEERGEEIILIYNGEEMKCGGKFVGRIRTLSGGGNEPKAKAYTDQAILLKFLSEKVVLNRANFNWNKSEFSREFKNAANAPEFLAIWGRLTELGETGYATRKASCGFPDTSTSSERSIEDNNVAPAGDIDLDPPGSKRLCKSKSIERNPIDLSIESKRVGLLRIPIQNTMEPPSCRLLRCVDPCFVESLVSKMITDPLGPGVPPLVIVCTSVTTKNQFKEHLKDVYKYEVHGGIHSCAARLTLLEENPTNEAYTYILEDVFVGLTDAECLRLAARHNINGHFHHEMTHRDYLEACRARLFITADKDISNDPTPLPSMMWKKSCTECTLPPDMSHTSKVNIFCQASFAEEGWSLAVRVMDMYEEGKLKQQKLSQKNLFVTPEFKQQHFLPLHHLEVSVQLSLLQLVVDQEYTLSEMKEASNTHRAMTTIKRSFIRCTGTQNWEEAVARFEGFADESRLAQFAHSSFRKQIPDPFRDYCQAALNSQHPIPVDCYTIMKEGANGHVLQADPTTLTAAHIKQAISSYNGANLITVHIPQDWSEEKMVGLAYTS